jgi:hypothetical protein
MKNLFELWDRAREVYARARSTLDQVEKRKLMAEADGYLRRAEEIRRTYAVAKAEYPQPQIFPERPSTR